MKNSLFKRLGLFLIIMSTLLFLSCATKPSEKDVAWGYVQTNPTEFAQWCKERFPTLITEYIPGKKEIVRDTLFIPGKEIECPLPTKDNPKPKVKTDDLYIPTETEKCTQDTVRFLDTREIQIRDSEIGKLRNEIIDIKSKLEKTEEKNIQLLEENSKLKSTKFYGWVAFGILLAIIGLLTILKLRT